MRRLLRRILAWISSIDIDLNPGDWLMWMGWTREMFDEDEYLEATDA